MDLDKIISSIEKFRKDNKNVLVAIDGRSGSGKTSVSNEISSKIENSKVIHLDEFDLYQGESSYKKVLETVIKPNLNGKKSKVYILEGIFALNKTLIKYYDYKIWVDCPKEVGFERGLKRDIVFNGIDNSERWKTYWLPNEDEYVEKERPQEKADFVVDGTR